MQHLLHVKEPELVEDKLDIQKLKYEQRQSDNMTFELIQQPLGEPSDDFGCSLSSWRLNSGRELKSERNGKLSQSDEELKIVLERMDTKEKELKNLKEAAVEDANDPRKLYSLAQERIGERNIGNLAIKKLKLERASVTKFLKR
ncbi:hypothetical protein DKX38_027812 [Salix brachista]|uniref:Uncharacterized protein n=1 Tax=Salix brachista TaxID=2182728 RepID=A0A5N5J635_9ROSI|nr:hypothetical protein DKX38_027812 [Salix brachista]